MPWFKYMMQDSECPLWNNVCIAVSPGCSITLSSPAAKSFSSCGSLWNERNKRKNLQSWKTTWKCSWVLFDRIPHWPRVGRAGPELWLFNNPSDFLRNWVEWVNSDKLWKFDFLKPFWRVQCCIHRRCPSSRMKTGCWFAPCNPKDPDLPIGRIKLSYCETQQFTYQKAE